MAAFLDALWSIGGSGNFRALWLPTAADTTTNTDPSSPSRLWTYDADISARITTQGSGVVVSYSGTSQYATAPDAADLSFGNGLVDSPFTLIALANVTNTAARRNIFSKFRSDNANAEYNWEINSTDKLRLSLWDASVATGPNRTSDAAITQGALHLFGASYSGVGGATAASGITLYEDAAVIASTATNQPTYVAMENGTNIPTISGWSDDQSQGMVGSLGCEIIYAVALTTAQHGQVKVVVNTYFGTSL